MTIRATPFVFLLAILLIGAPSRAQSRNGFGLLQQRHRELFDNFADDLGELAEYCEGHEFDEAAARIRDLATREAARNAGSLPRKLQPELPNDLPKEERYWKTQLRYLQTEYARDLYLLSRRVLHAGYPSYAYELLGEVAFHDPDHAAARRILGFVRYGDEWVTPFAADMLRRRYVRHDEFGWLPKAHVERYEQGERQVNGRWMSAAREAEIRRDFRNAWEIRTDHYLIRTNHSLERGVELGRALEEFYENFYVTFAGFFHTPDQLQKLFEGTSHGRRRPAKPHVVHHFRTRAEYNERLRSRIPQIGITNGLYLTRNGPPRPGDRIAYFFHDENVDTNMTLFHEATHQLFYESESFDRPIADDGNFWLIEGIACYMESFGGGQDGPGRLGDPQYVRFAAARHNLIREDYYIPLERFTSMSMDEFLKDPQLVKNYSQASGVAQFFMHYDGGRYRDALIEQITQIYSAHPRRRERVASLEELTGVSFADLDRQYAEYMQRLDEKLGPTTIAP